MKNFPFVFWGRCKWLFFVFGSLAVSLAGHATESADQLITPRAVLNAMQRVADWQLAHPSTHPTTDWTQGAGYAGTMALVGISGDPKYRDAMLAVAENNSWKLGARM